MSFYTYPKYLVTKPMKHTMHRLHPILKAGALAVFCWTNVMADDLLIIDDRTHGDYESALGTRWRLVTDGVMGGVSQGTLLADHIDDRDCLHLRGEVRLENNGGFVQAALDLTNTAAFDATSYNGLLLDVYGNGERYNLHLRTTDNWLPWQSYRADFTATPGWQTVRLPFTDFTAYRISKPLNLTRLERIGIVAIGRAFQADLCVARVTLYRDATADSLSMPGAP